MKTKQVLLCLAVLIIGSCGPVLSLYPLYNEKDVVFDEKLLGNWSTEPNKYIHTDINMKFSRKEGEDKVYQLIYAFATHSAGDYNSIEYLRGIFDTRLVKIANRLFLDVSNEETFVDVEDLLKQKWPVNSGLLISAHTFAIVDSLEPQLKIRTIEGCGLASLLNNEPNAIKHESNSSNGIILTAGTVDLQKFVIKYADNKEIFCEEMIFNRQKANEAENIKNNIRSFK